MKTFDLGAVTAYALAVKNGFEGTVEEWLESLVPKISVGTVETGEPGSDVVVTMDGNAKTPVLNFRIPRGKPGAVTTVNGVSPDENGNVQVETSSQYDWNAAEGEPGHIAHRTHWTERGGLVEVLAECQPPYIESEGFMITEGVPTLSVGETYIVNWNGVEYTCIGQDASSFLAGAVLLGDGSPLGLVANGEPFTAVCGTDEEGSVFMIQPMDGSTELTLSIMGMGEVVHHLDPKYIKDMYYTEDGGMVEILPETTLTTAEDNLGEFYIEENPPVLVAGNTYIVNWNGTEYTSTAQDRSAMMAGAVSLGDVYTFSDGAFGTVATGEPFVLIYVPGLVFSAQAIKATEELSLTLSIHQRGEIVHKTPNKYLDLDWFPTKTEGEVAFLPETTIEFSNGQYLGTTTNMLTLGDKYTVLLDGESYSFVAKQMDVGGGGATFYLGNHGLTGGEDTGEPLLYATSQITGDGELVAIMVVADAFTGSKTVAISHFNQTYNKLPEPYLPESVESVTIRSSTAGSTKKFKLSVDDSGTITATEVT